MKALARLVAVVGAIGVGWFLFRASPREVVLVYDLAAAPDATALEVELRRDGALVRRAELRASGAGGGQLRHPVRLEDGDYVLGWRLAGPDGVLTGERPLEVREDATVVLALGR